MIIIPDSMIFMKNKYLKISVILVLIMFSINSCSKCTDEEKSHKKQEIQTGNQTNPSGTLSREENQASKTENSKEVNINVGKVESVDWEKVNATLLKPDKLSKYLPNYIKGFEKYPWSGGKSSDGIHSWTTASSEYVNPKKGFISVSIYDYGKGGYIPDKKYFENIPSEEGKISQKVKIEEGKAYLLWNEQQHSGTLYALIDNRFIIKIESNNLPKETGSMQDLLNYIDYYSLMQLARKSQ
jgi:hypothetical protein